MLNLSKIDFIIFKVSARRKKSNRFCLLDGCDKPLDFYDCLKTSKRGRFLCHGLKESRLFIMERGIS